MNKKLYYILIILLSGVFLISTIKVLLTKIEYNKADAIYEKSRDNYFHLSESEIEVMESDDNFPYINVDLKALKTINPEIIGWIWIPGTNINYPLLQSKENKKYLEYSYNLEKTKSGSIFIDYRNSINFSDDNTIIYGHNLKNGSMFGDLKQYSDVSYMAEHSDMYIFTEKFIFKYSIFSAFNTSCESMCYTFGFTQKKDFNEYIDYIKSCSANKAINAPADETPLLMLSTCTSQKNQRFVVHAYLSKKKSIAQP